MRLDPIIREELVEEKRDGVFERQKAALRPLARRQIRLRMRQRHIDKPRDLRWHRDQRIERAAVAFALQLQRDSEAQVRDEWKRVRRIDRERGQQRKYLRHEKRLQKRALFRRQFFTIEHRNAGAAHFSTERAPAILLPGQQFCCGRVDARKLFGGRQPIETKH